ncbi:MAG: ParB/RepB/Spo0J family partition protein [Kiritimatiellae bacterium]|nr:ParB/RepB/Spo0J family partition protein [Kiritimatiellia bacterium]
MSAKHGLGRGLGALIKEVPVKETSEPAPAGIARVPVGEIRRNPWQPRHEIDPATLEDLVHSIRDRGVLQPLLIRKVQDGYELIAGERRLRAAQEAELKEVPVVIKDVSDREALELALVENLQREDLNLIEEADGYRVLCEKFGMTQEQVAQQVGKGRATVANAMRVLALPESVKQLISRGEISAGHAKVLLALEIPAEQELLAKRIVREGLSVRSLEKIIEKLRKPPRKPRGERSDIPDSHLRHLSDRLHQHLGTSVRVTPCKTLPNGKKVRGCLEIDFHSPDELDRLLVILGLHDDL